MRLTVVTRVLFGVALLASACSAPASQVAPEPAADAAAEAEPEAAADNTPKGAEALSPEQIAQRFGDAVWRVEVEGCGSEGSGTAFAIDAHHLVTNGHVVATDPRPALVARDGAQRVGAVLGYSEVPDLAVIRVEEELSTWLDWAATSELAEGQRLTALSYPTPLLNFAVSPGTLLSFQVEDDERIAIASDEITDYGSSGAPILTERGAVAGVVTEFADGDGRQVVGLSYTHDYLRVPLAEMLRGTEPVDADCAAFGATALPESFAGAAPEGRAGGDDYGSDDALDGFWDACEDGDALACDDLFRYSPVGSAYESFGDSCGERNEPSGWCVDLYPDGPDEPAASGPVPGTPDMDPALEALWQACDEGDFAACDDLYFESPVGSEYEAFGDSCGDRNEPAGLCVDVHEPGTDAPTGGDGGNSDPALDQLRVACDEGDFAACDDLYFESPVGSEYEAFGDSCGERNEPAGLCTEIYG